MAQLRSRKTPLDLNIIERVREMRMRHNMTQAILAAKLELSTSFIGDIESPNRQAKYNLSHLNQLAKIFNCSPRDFLPENPI